MIREFSVLARAFGGVSILALRPQDIPASNVLFGLCLTGYTLANLAIQLLGLGLSEALISSLLESAIIIALTRTLLHSRGCGRRATQTLTALFGTGIVMAPPALLLRYWLVVLDAGRQQSGIATLLWIALFAWNLLVTAHVLRHALEVRLFVGFSIALAYAMILLLTVVAVHEAVLTST